MGRHHGRGVARLDHGVVTAYTERDGLPSGFIDSIRGDAEGNVWIKTSGGLARFDGAKLEPTLVTGEKRSGSFTCRRGTEACGFATGKKFCVLGPTAPSRP